MTNKYGRSKDSWDSLTKNLGDNDGEGGFPHANEHKWDGESNAPMDDEVLGQVDICTQRHLPNSDPANETDDCGKDNYSYQDQPWDRSMDDYGGDFTYEDDPQEKHRGE